MKEKSQERQVVEEEEEEVIMYRQNQDEYKRNTGVC